MLSLSKEEIPQASLVRLVLMAGIKQAALACCKLYVSEGKNGKALGAIEKAARVHPHAVLLNVFQDREYNRVGYTLASLLTTHHQNCQAADKGDPVFLNSDIPLQATVLGMVRAALQVINLEGHCGTHPRLGVVDHICFHPLGGEASLQQVSSLARSVAADIVPTFLYGAAHHEGRTLDSIRRALGYFRPNCKGQWVGLASSPLSLSPDYGPSYASASTGLIIVGASPWVVNYNVPVLSNDLVKGRRIARKVSARGGGLHAVQAMALLHGDKVMEIACNLLDAKNVGPDKVQEEVISLADKEGLRVGPGYLTDYLEDKILESALQSLKLANVDISLKLPDAN